MIVPTKSGIPDSRPVPPEVPPLQTSFGVNMLALNRGRPELMGLREMVGAFVAFREEVVLWHRVFCLSDFFLLTVVLIICLHVKIRCTKRSSSQQERK